jgi:hypothetical protein
MRTKKQTWKEKFERARKFLFKVWNFAYRYKIEFDTEVQGKKCKLAAYQIKDRKLFFALIQEAYDKAVELSKSEDKEVKMAAKDVLDYVEMIAKSFEFQKMKTIMSWAKDLNSTEIVDGKIKVSIEGVDYELDEKEIQKLAQVDEDIRKYYEKVLKNVEERKKEVLMDKLWNEEIKNNWVRRTLLSTIMWPAGIGKREGNRGIWYYGIDMNIIPSEIKEKIKEKIKEYVIYLKNTKGIQNIDSFISPLIKSTSLPAGWYVFDKNKEKVESILKELAEQYATYKDREVVEEYKKLQKELLRR